MSWNKFSTGGSGSGSDGKSAYQIWLDQGNSGTEADFLLSLKGDKGDAGGGGSAESIGRSTKKPTISFIFDDTMKYDYDTIRPVFKARGIRYTAGLRTDYVGASLTYDMIREMQSEGFEFAYHGTKHNFSVAELEADINAFMIIAEAQSLNIKGFIGPNGLWDETIVTQTFKNLFKWSRGSGGGTVATVTNPLDYFKAVKGNFIDDLTSDAALTTLKTKVDALAERGTGFIGLSMHVSATQMPHLTNLLDYIISKGIEIKTVYDAWQDYGGVIEYFSKDITVNSNNLLERGDGNEARSYNSARPHFIVQRDGTVISNFSPVQITTPKKGNKAINGNTLASEFDVGVSIIQYGTADDGTGLPGGTLYNFNLGKNSGAEQFQLMKNGNGLFFREAKTDGTWNPFTSKLGIYRPVPAATNAAGKTGDFSADANYLYICHANNAWIRIAKDSTWTTIV